LALSLYIGPELIYIDVTPVAGKGKNMLFLEQQRELLDVKAQHAFFETQRHLLDVKAQHAFF
jgi:hypothetical protein